MQYYAAATFEIPCPEYSYSHLLKTSENLLLYGFYKRKYVIEKKNVATMPFCSNNIYFVMYNLHTSSLKNKSEYNRALINYLESFFFSKMKR